MLTYCPNCSRNLFFANRRRFAKIRSSRKLGRLQYYTTKKDNLFQMLRTLCLKVSLLDSLAL
ncbi:MAG: hypothetical protein PV344_04655, partial [Anaplasma sp.]|nr:hypothetical protein [Anaplasma sp.]